jgi:hypothetical protein
MSPTLNLGAPFNNTRRGFLFPAPPFDCRRGSSRELAELHIVEQRIVA